MKTVAKNSSVCNEKYFFPKDQKIYRFDNQLLFEKGFREGT